MTATASPRPWRDDVLDALVPGLIPADRPDFWRAWDAEAPPLLRLGLQAAVIAVVLGGLRYGRLFPALSAERKDALLTSLVGHPSWTVRQLGAILKLVAGFAIAWHDDARARLEPR